MRLLGGILGPLDGKMGTALVISVRSTPSVVGSEVPPEKSARTRRAVSAVASAADTLPTIRWERRRITECHKRLKFGACCGEGATA